MCRACLIQKRIAPKCSHCKQREWKRKNLKRILDVAHPWLQSIKKSCSPGKDTQVKLDVKVTLYQLRDHQDQKPESNPSQKKSDKDK